MVVKCYTSLGMFKKIKTVFTVTNTLTVFGNCMRVYFLINTDSMILL